MLQRLFLSNDWWDVMIRFQLFGVPDLRTASGAKAFTVLAQAKQVALLSLLCSARHGSVRRDRLLALLWPDLDDTRARNSLSKAIHNCRRSLGDGAIGGRFAEEIALDTATWSTDLWEFDDAIAGGDRDAALEIARRGEFLDGLLVPDSVAIEQWIDAQRTRIRRLALESATALADRHEAAGDLERTALYLREASALSPLDERVVRRRISISDRLGDRAGALETFAEFRTLLQRELVVDVSPETLAVMDSIRRRALLPGAESAGKAPAPPAALPVPTGEAASPATDVRRTDPSSAAPPSVEVAARTVTSRKPGGRQLVGAALLVGVILAGALAATKGGGGTQPATAGRVIVAPFVNQSSDSTLAPIGELAADLLAAALSRAGVEDVADTRTRMLTGLTVASPASGGDNDDLADRAGRAGFSTIITGRYNVRGGILTVIAQLRSAATALPVIFAEERGPVTDPVSVLRKVEQRLLGAFAAMHDPRLRESSTGVAAVPTYAAYTEYVAGLKPWIDDDMKAAAAHFERAFKLDSGFVSVVPLLYESLILSNRRDAAESLLAGFATRRHLLAPYDRAQLDYISGFHNRDRESMYEATQRMVRLAPHSPDAQWSRGFAAATTNRFAEAIEAFQAADAYGWKVKDKLFASLNWQSISFHLLGRYDEELALVRKVMAQDPFEAEACYYELRALAPRHPRDAIQRVLDDCIRATGGADIAWQANARMFVAAELTTHDRPVEAEYFARAAVPFFETGIRRDSTAQQLREGLAAAQMALGRWSDALPYFEGAARRLPNNRPPRFAASTAIIAAKLGQMALSDSMLARISESTPVPAFHLQRARVLANRGRPDDAIAELRTAIATGLSAAELFHANPGYEPIRRHPAYIDLVKPR